VARAQLAALTARRQVLLAESGGDLARQLRDLNAERSKLQAELADAEELVGLAKTVADERREAARHDVESYRHQGWCDATRAAGDREEQVREKLASTVEDLLSQLLEATQAVENLRYQAGERPTVAASGAEGLLAGLEREAARANAEPKPKAAAAPTTA
jgi:hypothetical protein